MTMRGPNYDKVAQQFGATHQERWKTRGKHIGDIEQFKVLQDGIYYSIWNNDVLVAYSSLSSENNTVDDIWVNPDYQNQRVFSKMLWFFKTRLNRNPLMLGPIHSQTMQEVVKGLSRFDKSWVNVRTNEKVPFSVDTLDNFYSYSQITPWRLVLENTGDFSEWPMFNTGSSYIKEDYTEITK